MIPPEIVRLCPRFRWQTQEVLPVALDGETLTLASHRPHDIAFEDQSTFLLNRKIVLVASSRNELRSAIFRHYGSSAASGSPSTDVRYRINVIGRT